MKKTRQRIIGRLVLLSNWIVLGDLFGFVSLYRRCEDKGRLIYRGDVLWNGEDDKYYLVLNGITGKMVQLGDSDKFVNLEDGYFKMYSSPRWYGVLSFLERLLISKK